jgi:hypothetical protein
MNNKKSWGFNKKNWGLIEVELPEFEFPTVLVK